MIESKDKDELWWTKNSQNSANHQSDESKRRQERLVKKDDPLESILMHQKTIDKHKEMVETLLGPKLKRVSFIILIIPEIHNHF